MIHDPLKGTRPESDKPTMQLEHASVSDAVTDVLNALGPVVAPLFANGAWPATGMALIVVDVSSVEPWRLAATGHVGSSRARDVVAGALLADRAVLLSRRPSAGSSERIIVAAFGSAAGGAAIADRIREGFARDLTSGLTCTVTCTMLDTVPAAADASVEASLLLVATRLEEAVRAYVIEDATSAALADADLGAQQAAMARAFITRHLRNFHSLTAAVDANDYEVLRTYGHNLKGTGRSYGYPELSDVARALEEAATVRDPHSVRKYLAALDQALRGATV